MILGDIVVILCRVTEPGNVGAVCRAMKNMGLSRLRLAGTGRLEEDKILNRAIHAAELWQNAEFYETLPEAAADCTLLVGTTRRRGRGRKNITFNPRSLALWLRDRPGKGPVALVFGNERTGLEDSELDMCNAASHIPASDAFPSLNLSHAVQIYAYELFLALGQDSKGENSALLPNFSSAGEARQGFSNENSALSPFPVKGEWVPLDRTGADAIVCSITDTLAGLGFYKHPGRQMQERFLRDVVLRAGLTEREGRYFKDIFAKAARLGSMNNGEKTNDQACL
jgi:tRNA/rRNA methyltransferase/tRNA (cytidine32/uridine32-2'-O)-methyltransferase